ncbi:MAG TPA: YciI family protein [Gemmatimonadaceae bacterium]|nr:YciI family protein [Gemmatimonadaceae bacterium]
MRFMTIYKPGRETTSPPSQEHIDAMTKLIGDMAKSGTLITTDGLQHSSKGARVSINADGSFKVVDGPFTEAKEIIGGYAIINVNSKAEAVELTKTFLKTMGEGESEIRQMQDAPAYDAKSAAQSANAGQRSQEATR